MALDVYSNVPEEESVYETPADCAASYEMPVLSNSHIASTDMTTQAKSTYTAMEGVTLEPNPSYSAVQATSTYEPITGHGEVQKILYMYIVMYQYSFI